MDATGKIKIRNQGFIRLVDWMGTDYSVVQAARVSYDTGTKTYRSDRQLIRYLIRHRHTSPLEMVVAKFHIRLPLYVARQWMRHRTWSYSERSGRYSEMASERGNLADMYDIIGPDAWRSQSPTARQSSGGLMAESLGEQATVEQITAVGAAQDAYRTLLNGGVAREQARTVLPVSLMTEMYASVDLHNLLHFLQLRMAPDAQPEIREYAEAIASIVQDQVPIVWEAFNDYRLHALTLSGPEVSALRAIIGSTVEWATLVDMEQMGLSKGEQVEFRAKLMRLGLEDQGHADSSGDRDAGLDSAPDPGVGGGGAVDGLDVPADHTDGADGTGDVADVVDRG